MSDSFIYYAAKDSIFEGVKIFPYLLNEEIVIKIFVGKGFVIIAQLFEMEHSRAHVPKDFILWTVGCLHCFIKFLPKQVRIDAHDFSENILFFLK